MESDQNRRRHETELNVQQTELPALVITENKKG